ncbi:MAG: N,N-dimethylformamidase beta subunit family domain-containing protein [Actinomycetota bacterium]
MTPADGGHPVYTGWPLVEGFCHPLSHVAGASIPLRCSLAAHDDRDGPDAGPATVTVEVARIGATRELAWSATGIRVEPQPIGDRAWADGVDWPVTVAIPTEASWPSGYYEVQLHLEGHDSPRAQAEAFFVLRAPAGHARQAAVLVLATNTYQAYNQWGGRGLYSGARAVSFARPLERGYLRRPSAPDEAAFDGRITNIAVPSDPEHQALVDYQARHQYPLLTASAGWHNWERRFVRWAEANGFGLDVAINADLDPAVGPGPDVLQGYRMAVTVGHDEYWSWGMRDTIDQWVDGGGNWAIFAGNTCFWQVRFADDGQTMVCHKGSARRTDPVMGTDRQHLLTSMWADPVIGRPESTTTGLTFTRGGYHRVGQAEPQGSGAFTVHRPDHWALAGTGLRHGDRLGVGSFIVGYEVDGCTMGDVDGRPVRTADDGGPLSFEIAASSPARLISIDGERCEAPTRIWASVDPPGDLEEVATTLFGDAEPASVARLGSGHAVLGSFTRGRGRVFNAGSADWAYGLDADPLVQQVTANVLRILGTGAARRR